MKFGLSFGIQKRGGTPPSEIDPADWYINVAGATGTHTITPLANGFELELYGDGTDPLAPIALNILATSIPALSNVRYTYDIELLSGVNPIDYQIIVVSDTANKYVIAPGSYSFDYTTTNTTTYSAFYFNETLTGKVRITNVTIAIL